MVEVDPITMYEAEEDGVDAMTLRVNAVTNSLGQAPPQSVLDAKRELRLKLVALAESLE